MRTDRFLPKEREFTADVATDGAEAEVLEAVDKVAALVEQSRMRGRTSRRKIPQITAALQKKMIQRKRMQSRKNQRKKGRRIARQQVL